MIKALLYNILYGGVYMVLALSCILPTSGTNGFGCADNVKHAWFGEEHFKFLPFLLSKQRSGLGLQHMCNIHVMMNHSKLNNVNSTLSHCVLTVSVSHLS